MDAAGLLNIKAVLGKLRYTGALTTEQFGLLKGRAKHGGVTEQVLALLSRAWGLRRNSTLDEEEFADVIKMVIREMPQPGGISAVEKAAWYQGVDIERQACPWADSSFCNSWTGNT